MSKPEQFANIKLYVPRLVWSHNNRTELQTLPNITFWPKTELQTCRTSQKREQLANIELFIPRLVCTIYLVSSFLHEVKHRINVEIEQAEKLVYA